MQGLTSACIETVVQHMVAAARVLDDHIALSEVHVNRDA